MISRFRAAVVAGSLLAAVAACGGDGPVPIAYDGSETCAVCRMTVDDPRFGSQLVTRTGRALNFDSIECLARFAADSAAASDGARGLWVPDYFAPGTMMRVGDARFVRSPRINSPMGAGLVAVTAGRAADTAWVREVEGTVLDWSGVVRLVSAGDMMGGGGMMHRHGAPVP